MALTQNRKTNNFYNGCVSTSKVQVTTNDNHNQMLTFAITMEHCILLITIQTYYQFKHIQKYITYSIGMLVITYVYIAFVIIVVCKYSIYT